MQRYLLSRPYRPLGATICLLLFTVGCGSNRPEMVHVYGRVTLDGGDWPKPGVLNFSPVDPAPGFSRRPASAHFGKDGRFTTEAGQGEGLIPGTYRVAVTCWQRAPTDKEPVGQSYVAEEYAEFGQSELELRIEPGSEPVEWNMDFPRADEAG